MKTAMYDIEKNNINNPEEELKGKASALRNIGGAAIAGSVAANLGAPLTHSVYVAPTPTPYLTANVEHKFGIPAVVPPPAAVVTTSNTNVVHPTISVVQDKKSSESKSDTKAENKAEEKADKKNEAAEVYGNMADYGQTVKDDSEEQVIDNE